MRSTIEIDDKLMQKAMRISGASTKKAVVEEALTLLIQIRGQESIRALRGRIQWEGDLEELRRNRT